MLSNLFLFKTTGICSSGSLIELESDLESSRGDLMEISQRISRVWKKIKDGRKAGLEKEGEYSLENLVFKLLRRNGYIQRIIDVKRQSYDKRYK